MLASCCGRSLKKLTLFDNQIKKLPGWLSTVAGNLVDLNLSKLVYRHRDGCSKCYEGVKMFSNSIDSEGLPECSLELPCLQSLVFAHNAITVLPEQLLKNCADLETLDLTENKLGIRRTCPNVVCGSFVTYCMFEQNLSRHES